MQILSRLLSLARMGLLALALSGVTASAALSQPAACPQFFSGGQAPALVNARLAQRTTLLCNDAYAVLASGVTHGAIWSAERLTTGSVAAARDTVRESAFYADSRLPEADQAQLEDYRRSGFDRGHMTPSGDMAGWQAQAQSFSLANMVPQTPALNRGIWAGIEMAVRDLAAREGELFVVTGPAFQGSQLQSIGPGGVLVPSATWKAIYDPQAGGTGVYVCANTSMPRCDIAAVATLIAMVGVDPFPALPASMKTTTIALPAAEASRHRSSRRRRQRQPDSLLEPASNQ
jgi:endonuclease G